MCTHTYTHTYLFSGGQVGGPCPLRDSWIISLTNRKWVEFPQCPSPRTRHAMVAVRRERERERERAKIKERGIISFDRLSVVS